MVESEAQELPEDVMLGAVVFGHEQMQAAIKAINELADEGGKPRVGLGSRPAKDDGAHRARSAGWPRTTCARPTASVRSRRAASGSTRSRSACSTHAS